MFTRLTQCRINGNAKIVVTLCVNIIYKVFFLAGTLVGFSGALKQMNT